MLRNFFVRTGTINFTSKYVEVVVLLPHSRRFPRFCFGLWRYNESVLCQIQMEKKM